MRWYERLYVGEKAKKFRRRQAVLRDADPAGTALHAADICCHLRQRKMIRNRRGTIWENKYRICC